MLRRLSLSLCLVKVHACGPCPTRGGRGEPRPEYDYGHRVRPTTIQTILIEANQILELTPLEDGRRPGDRGGHGPPGGTGASRGPVLRHWSIQAQSTALFNLDTGPGYPRRAEARLAEIKPSSTSATAMRPVSRRSCARPPAYGRPPPGHARHTQPARGQHARQPEHGPTG